MIEVYFFGCWNDSSGHFLWRPTATRYENMRHQGVLPWPQIDGTLAPLNGDETQGKAVLTHLDGWTALAWWDRSVDKRRGSNAAIFARGTHDAAAMLELGRKHFPGVMARFQYTIELVKA